MVLKHFIQKFANKSGTYLFRDLSEARKISAHPKRLSVVEKKGKRKSNNYSDDEESDGDYDDKKDVNFGKWWSDIVPKELNDVELSGKCVFLFSLIRECQTCEDVLLVFSQYTKTLDLIEEFIRMTLSWERDADYYRFDGQTDNKTRDNICKIFKNEKYSEAK